MFSFLKEDNGNFSSMRFLVIAVVLIQMITWAVMCVKSNQLISWDAMDVSVLGAAFGAKVFQKGREK